MDMLGSADEWTEVAELFGQCHQHFILIVNGVCEEWNEFLSRTIDAQRQCDCRQLADAVQTQL